ncbi:hypothetical protein A8926_4639 [Saccharopolyspora spinosa]|uniref:Uncharacterized protein n=1 Tax=Saccharopolyspora spinosa TaxID=60894 RepID=A0A2N3Y1E7_SACSN|nr:hypothetical protein A8926_4639 [Saccharopolyspora spinosa]
MCVRGDTDFSLTANFDRWAGKADFVFGMDNNPALRGHAEALDEKGGHGWSARRKHSGA